MSSGHDCKDCNERYNACTCSVAKCPPIGLLPKKYWLQIRAQDIRDAIRRHTVAGISYPDDWVIELRELQND